MIFPARKKKSKCKGPEARAHVMYSVSSKETRVRSKGIQGRLVGIDQVKTWRPL